MALSQIVKELILGLMGGEPERQQEIIDGLDGGLSAVQDDGSTPFIAPQGGIDPVVDSDLATKLYVDNAGSGGANQGLSNLANTNLNDDLIPDTDVVYTLGNGSRRWVRIYLDELRDNTDNTVLSATNRTLNDTSSSPVISWGAGFINANNYIIGNVIDPVSAQDAATKNYVDTHSSGSPQEFYMGAAITDDDTKTNTGAFASFGNTNNTLTVTPTNGGKFKIYAFPNMEMFTAGTSNPQFKIHVTSGSPSTTFESVSTMLITGSVTGSVFMITGQPLQSVYTLATGVPYTFQIQAHIEADNTVKMTGANGQFAIFAERVSD